MAENPESRCGMDKQYTQKDFCDTYEDIAGTPLDNIQPS